MAGSFWQTSDVCNDGRSRAQGKAQKFPKGPRPCRDPVVAAAADSLCRLIEYTPNAAQIPLRLLNQHVEAVRAIYREYARSDAQQLAAMLTRSLREVTDELLISQKRGWPEVLAQINAPPLAVTEASGDEPGLVQSHARQR